MPLPREGNRLARRANGLLLGFSGADEFVVEEFLQDRKDGPVEGLELRTRGGTSRFVYFGEELPERILDLSVERPLLLFVGRRVLRKDRGQDDREDRGKNSQGPQRRPEQQGCRRVARRGVLITFTFSLRLLRPGRPALPEPGTEILGTIGRSLNVWRLTFRYAAIQSEGTARNSRKPRKCASRASPW